MEKCNDKEFQSYCVDSLPLLSGIKIPFINMYNDYEAIFVYFEHSIHVEFIIKNTILKLGNSWSYTVVCCYSNYNFILSLCCKISENIKVLKINNNDTDILKYNNFINMFHGEKIFIYDENIVIINDSIHEFLHWDYVGIKLTKDNYHYNGSCCLISKDFAIDISNNLIDEKYKLPDENVVNKFVSINKYDDDCFACDKHCYFNLNYKMCEDYYNTTHYKILNLELYSLNKTELLNHFKHFGYYEKKKSHLKNKDMHKYIAEYCDFDIQFDSEHYAYFNPSLAHLNRIELLRHYNTIGKYHKNIKAFDSEFPVNEKQCTLKIDNQSNCVVFINESSEDNDETQFLYEYVIYLQQNNIYENILLFDVIFNEALTKYYNRLKNKPIFFCNNFILLNELLRHYNPTFIYSNSLNYLTLNIDKFSQNIINKTIFHFHNSMELIPPSIKNLKDNTIYCSHEKINEHLYSTYGVSNTHVFRHFISEENIDKYNYINLFGNDNITFGMFGKNNYENGYDIFVNLAKKLPQYNFLWVGENDDSSFLADNFVKITSCIDVYKYINIIDYLLVTCRNKTPRVVLKALYSNCRCIILENKMTQILMTSGICKIKDHNNDFNNIIEYFNNNITLTKKCCHNNKTKPYIIENFTKPYIYKHESILGEMNQQCRVDESNINGTFNWRHYLIINPDLTENNILSYDSALEHWTMYGKSENRYSVIRHCDIEEQLNQYNNLKQIVSENWIDYHMEQVIRMKIKGSELITMQKYLFDNLAYIQIREQEIVSKLCSSISKCIFNDNYSELKILPKKNGYIDLSIFGIDTNYVDIEYILKNYKNCWLKLDSLDDANIFWNVFGKNNNYLKSTENELYEDLYFDWEYYTKANRLTFPNKIQAFLHWNKWGKRGALIASNMSLKKTYDEFLQNKYDLTIRQTNNTFFTNQHTNVFIDSSILSFGKEFNKPLFNELKIIKKVGILRDVFLIIDFPNYGGGSEHFINCITSKYKKRYDFLIVRSFNHVLHFYLNDKSKIERTYNDEEAVEYIQSIKCKIKTIFVNSIIGHSENFVNSLFTLDIPVDAITHDYSLLYKFPQGYYHEMMNTLPNSFFPLNKCRTIITQNEKNIALYGSSVNNNKFVVSELPDHVKGSKKIKTNNEELVIGIVGNISNLKGYYLIEKIVEYAKTQNNIRIVLFGNIPYFDNMFIEKYPYKNIDEFNDLLIKHKPNLWLETSLWPETYSYTLTLMMITGLPIFYQKKYYPSVITDRLSKYVKSYPFENIDSLLENMEQLASKKQNFFHTIDTNIYFNEFWDSYFGDNVLKSNNVVFISSKIIVSTNKFDYSDSRSIYTSEERYSQTLKTIESIRKYIPNSFIILFDNSDFNEKQYNELNTTCHLFLNVCNDINIYDYTNNKVYKLYGELAQTAHVLKHITENLGHLTFDNFFKISGRYWINENFNFSDYNNEDNIFKRKIDVTDRRYYYTSFYKISYKNFKRFTDLIVGMFNESKTNNDFDGYDWEVLLSKKMNYDFIELASLGITENIAVWKQETRI